MRGKKVTNNHQIIQNVNQKIDQNKILKKRVAEVKSLEPKFKANQMVPQVQRVMKLPLQNSVNDYELERRQRQTHEHQLFNQPNGNLNFVSPNNQQTSRFQRNTEKVRVVASRQNYLLNSQQDRSNQNSVQKIKLVSADSKQKPVSRSQNSSAKKRGIELTKTLLKRISGMYNDKDFQNRVSFVNKSSKEETSGLMTTTLSGRGVCDEYQISDFDFQVPPNHTFNISTSNPLSFNDSGSWNRNSAQWNNTIILNKQSCQLYSSQHQNTRNNQLNQSKEKMAARTPQKELLKVRSYDLINTQRTADSIIVGEEPPSRPQLTRRGAQANPQNQSREKYLIHSKNKTMDQISLKESMVVGFDHYYQ